MRLNLAGASTRRHSMHDESVHGRGSDGSQVANVGTPDGPGEDGLSGETSLRQGRA